MTGWSFMADALVNKDTDSEFMIRFKAFFK